MMFRVIWEIDIDADDPKEAARKALKIHRDPESIADSFQVHHESLPSGGVTFDLEEDRESEEEDEGKGGDLCDTCSRTDREISHTEDGKTVCVTCAKEE
jgi:hypothetical protein